MSRKSSWTLRGGAPDEFRQTERQTHPAARRAHNQVSRHIMEVSHRSPLHTSRRETK